MKIKILKVYEKDGNLRIETECEFGKDNLGLSLEAKYKAKNGKYKWENEIEEILKKKYIHEDKEVFSEFHGKTFDI